jgi:hypothetical protein
MMKSTLAATVATLILFGHLSVIVHIFGFKDNFIYPDNVDLATVVGPVTATYLATAALGVVAIQNGQGNSDPARFVYILFCVVLTLFYFFGCHWIVGAAEPHGEGLEVAQLALASLEALVGASLVIFLKDLFGS